MANQKQGLAGTKPHRIKPGRAKRAFLFSACAAFLLGGCVQKEIIDDVRLVTGMAYDAAEGNKVVGTILMPYYMPDQAIENITLTAVGSPTRDIFKTLQRESPEPIVGGSIEITLFGKDFAKKGIYQGLDALQRDPGIGTGSFLAVVDGNGQEILEGKYGKRGNSTFMADLIRHNAKNRDLPKTNMHLFLSDFYRKGKSPYLPQIKKKGKDTVEITGISLFKDDKVIDTVPAEKMFFFKLMVEKYSEGTTRVDLGKQEAVLESLKSEYKRKLISRSPAKIDVGIKVKTILHQYTGKVLEEKQKKEVERAIEKKIEKTCGGLVKRFQKKDIDPFGLGYFVKSKTRGFDYQKWRRSGYKDLKVTIHADVEILESGVIE